MINELIEENVDFASKIAFIFKKKLPKNIDVEDLKSSAYYGLVKAAHRYDDALGVFTTFAYCRIVGEIKDYLRKFHHRSFLSLEDSGDFVSKTVKSGDFLEKFQKDLPSDSISILKSYFYDDKSMKEIGESLNLSESRISQVITSCKTIIKENYEKEELWADLYAA